MANLGDFLKAINYTKENLMVKEDNIEKDYLPFIINRTLSYQPDCLIWAQEMNMRPFTDSKMQFDFLLNSIRKKKRFARWIKPDKNADIIAIKEYYGYSNKKAMEVLDIISSDYLSHIHNSLVKGGIKK